MREVIDVVLIGGGGHASDVLQAIEASNAVERCWRVVGILDDHAIDTRRFVNRAVGQIGSIAHLTSVDAAYILAIGWPTTRRALADRIGSSGAPAPAVVHPSADVGVGVEMERGAVVLGHAHLSPLVRLGAHALISYNASVGHDTTLGPFASIMPGAAVSGGVVIGAQTLVGTGASVREGVRIGDGVTVGTGAAVVSDVADGLTVVGVPAQPME
jgi:sugar O-acyltransferase (sialic acid O-acetyltransferase NeuD family)